MKRKQFTNDENGQAYSLEGIASAILLISAVLLAINATAITPLTASTSNQQIEEQNRILAEDMLDSTSENNEIHDYLEDYDGETETTVNDWRDSNIQFKQTMYNSFDVDNNIAYNIYITYETQTGEMVTEQTVDQGEPSDHAAMASRNVVIHDYMIEDEDDTYIDSIDNNDDQSVYNVVEVKIELWRM